MECRCKPWATKIHSLPWLTTCHHDAVTMPVWQKLYYIYKVHLGVRPRGYLRISKDIQGYVRISKDISGYLWRFRISFLDVSSKDIFLRYILLISLRYPKQIPSFNILHSYLCISWVILWYPIDISIRYPWNISRYLFQYPLQLSDGYPEISIWYPMFISLCYPHDIHLISFKDIYWYPTISF